MAPPKCTVCNALEATECQICKSTAYCSDKCRREDERLHQMLCKQFATFTTANPRPCENAVLAICLAPDSKVPRLVWIAGDDMWKMNIVTMGKTFDNPIYHDYLGPGNPDPKSHRITRHSNPDFALDHTVALDCRDLLFCDRSKTNLCVSEMFNKEKHCWRGQIIVLSWPGLEEKRPTAYQDVTASDLHFAVDYLKSYGDGPEKNVGLQPKTGLDTMKDMLPSLPRSPNLIHGVDISCKGDQEFLGKPKIYKVEIPSDHKIFKASKPTSISFHMGLPLLVREYGNLDQSWRVRGAKMRINPFQNRTALYLNLNADSKSEEWGFTDLREWDCDIGTILVVRQDKKDITPQQVEALTRFCRYELSPLMSGVEQDSCCDGYPDSDDECMAKEKFIKEQMCKEKFEAFFEKLKKEKLDAGDGEWKKAVSPYKI